MACATGFGAFAPSRKFRHFAVGGAAITVVFVVTFLRFFKIRRNVAPILLGAMCWSIFRRVTVCHCSRPAAVSNCASERAVIAVIAFRARLRTSRPRSKGGNLGMFTAIRQVGAHSGLFEVWTFVGVRTSFGRGTGDLTGARLMANIGPTATIVTVSVVLARARSGTRGPRAETAHYTWVPATFCITSPRLSQIRANVGLHVVGFAVSHITVIISSDTNAIITMSGYFGDNSTATALVSGTA